jgi:hypothetical protein
MTHATGTRTRDSWAGNKCDVCGKFRAPSLLVEHESKSLDEYGTLREKWWLECSTCRESK